MTQYSINANPRRICTLRGTTSAGELILEDGHGTISIVNPNAATQIGPYTVRIQVLHNSSKSYSRLANPGEVEVGDILIYQDKTVGGYFRTFWYVVAAVDTQDLEAKTKLTGRKVVTSPLGE